jgi:hypothetical protein
MDVSLSESDIGKVKVGQQATVTVNADSGAEFAARVASVSVLATSGSSSAVSYPVTLKLDQSGSKLKAGMSATADIVVAAASGLTVPSAAVTGSTVTLVKNGKQTTQAVQTGVFGDTSTEILSGVVEGDQVLVRSISAAAGASATGGGGSGAQQTGVGGAAAALGGGGATGLTGAGGGGFRRRFGGGAGP